MAIEYVGQVESGYITERGWSDRLARELVEASKEPTIKKFSPNDHTYRFRDIFAAHAWYGDAYKAPEVYTLRDERTRQLAGLAWFSHQHNELIDESYDTTFAIRLYENARGKGLSYPFAIATHQDLGNFNPKAERIWLQTDEHNYVAKQLYKKIGYTTLAVDKNRLVMGIDMPIS
jgi:RimJ/RimL family protein N-acetyltransferase